MGYKVLELVPRLLSIAREPPGLRPLRIRSPVVPGRGRRPAAGLVDQLQAVARPILPLPPDAHFRVVRRRRGRGRPLPSRGIRQSRPRVPLASWGGARVSDRVRVHCCRRRPTLDLALERRPSLLVLRWASVHFRRHRTRPVLGCRLEIPPSRLRPSELLLPLRALRPACHSPGGRPE